MENANLIPDTADDHRHARAVVIRGNVMWQALMLDGPDAGRAWALSGEWTPGEELRVAYWPEDQFCDPLEAER